VTRAFARPVVGTAYHRGAISALHVEISYSLANPLVITLNIHRGEGSTMTRQVSTEIIQGALTKHPTWRRTASRETLAASGDVIVTKLFGGFGFTRRQGIRFDLQGEFDESRETLSMYFSRGMIKNFMRDVRNALLDFPAAEDEYICAGITKLEDALRRS
jgi:hypothetical protein